MKEGSYSARWKRWMKQHYRWRPHGGNTHNSAVNHMFTGALKLPVDVMYQHCDGCTHSHKSADPDTRKPRRENRGKLSGAHNLFRPQEEMRSHRRDARHLNCTVYFVDWEKFHEDIQCLWMGVFWTALHWTLASKHFTGRPGSLLLSGVSSYSL